MADIALKSREKDNVSDIRNLRVSLAALFAVMLIANITYPASHGWSRLILNILGYGMFIPILMYSPLKLSDIGLSQKQLKKGLIIGGSIGLVIFGGFMAAYLIRPDLFHDERYRQNFSTAVLAALVFLPLKTVLFEELAFRGFLPALLNKLYGMRVAVLGSSLLFGLWHISSSLHVSDYPVGDLFVIPGIGYVLIAVLLTSLAGYGLIKLRYISDSLLAPLLVHWSINAAAITLAALSWHS